MNTSTGSNSGSFDASGVKNQLKQIGDQIESIARQLKGQGNQQDIDELYELGDKVEHFCDHMDFSEESGSKTSGASFASQSNVGAGTSSNSSKVSNANQTGTKNQDQEKLDSGAKPVM